MIKVIINTPSKESFIIDADRKTNLLSLIQQSNISINALCNGLGKCGKCKIKIVSKGNSVNKITKLELKSLKPSEIKNGYRLACQTIVFNDVEIEIPEHSLPVNLNLTKMGYEPKVEHNPAIKKIFIKIKIDNFKDLKKNRKILLSEIKKHGFHNLEFNSGVKDTLLPLFDVSKGKLTVTIRDGKIIHLEEDNKIDNNFGFALDIGTTQLTAYLMDLNTGQSLDYISEPNKQIKFGADVISRLTYIMKGEKNLNNIHLTLISQINEILKRLIKKRKINPINIYEGVVVGNTVMMHTFHKSDPTPLSKYPYTPKIKKAVYKSSRFFNLKINRLSMIYTPPNIAGYMGSDIISDIISSEIYKEEDNSILIDIGTNTEIVLFYKNQFYGCSTPSGPSFEGGQLEFGMRAEKGAIDRIFIDPETHKLTYTTIGGVKPVGICGSGVIDAVAESYKIGLIDNTGTITSKGDLIINYKNMKAILIANNEEDNQIVITQKDIREIQKAKAAIQAGYLSLLKYVGGDLSEIEKVIIAGSFGVHINPESGKILGLIPDISDEKIRFYGNLAGSGARTLLKAAHLRKTCEEISKKIKYIELGNLKFFQNLWVKSLNITF
ncbi:MAG: ASKHA domain-containing protein [Candidatus Odinarchaeia archaeon]